MDIFPSASELPANTVRFHIVSDQDMRSSLKRRDISLRAELRDGGVGPSMSIGSISWSADGRCVTLDVGAHPTKRQRAKRVEERYFAPGRRYVMTVRVRNGCDAKDFLKAIGFNAVGADHSSLNSSCWKLVLPAIETRASLHLRFDRVMDRVSLLAGVCVIDDRGHLVDGALRCGPAESSIDFVPAENWSAGVFRLQLSGLITDVCGNRFAQLPDAALRRSPDASPGHYIKFHVR